MNADPGKETLDARGLPKIALHSGRDESDSRDFSRAPITSGGTITGKAFQTSDVDPRITLDSTSMICHDSLGRTTFSIDIATGAVNLLTTAGVAASIRFVDSTGVVQGDIAFSTAIAAGGGVLIEGIGKAAAIAYVTAANDFTTYPNTRVVALSTGTSMFSQGSAAINARVQSGTTGRVDASGTDGTRTFSLLFAPDAAFVNFIGVGDATARLRIGTGASGGTNPVDIINGQIVMSNGGAENDIICALAAFTTIVGCRYTSAAAADIGGIFDQFRQVRGTSAGVRVTPAGSTPSALTSTNVSGVSITAASPDGCMFNVSATAAGNTTAIYAVTFS